MNWLKLIIMHISIDLYDIAISPFWKGENEFQAIEFQHEMLILSTLKT